MQGMLLEARGEASKALKLYEDVLAQDKTNLVSLSGPLCLFSGNIAEVRMGHGQTIVKRRIAVLKSLDRQKAVEALVAYLDTYYADPEAWQEMAALYSELQM